MAADLRQMADDELAELVSGLAMSERERKAALVESIAELDARRLYLAAGCASLFVYCTQVLHLSEPAAYLRIEVARLCRRFPGILPRLADGRLSLATATIIGSVLTEDNQHAMLDKFAYMSRREVELTIASMRSPLSVPGAVRKIEADSTATGEREADSGRASVALAVKRPPLLPISADSYLVQFTLSHDGHARLLRAQNLLRHAIPNGEIAAIFERALATMVRELEDKKFGAPKRERRDAGPTRPSRYVPKKVRNAVWMRDGGQCAFVGTQGRCTEKAFLEYHHVIPFAAGGETTVENIQLRCASHNAYEATVWFGGDPAPPDEPPATGG